MKSLRARAWFSLVALMVVMGLLLFIPAGTLHYWQGWVYLLIFTAASALTTIELLKRDPALLERRMRGGPTAEKQATQRVIMVFASLGFIGLLVVPALDHRFGWSPPMSWSRLVSTSSCSCTARTPTHPRSSKSPRVRKWSRRVRTES